MDMTELLNRIYEERRALDASVQILKNMVITILEEEKAKRKVDAEDTIERMLAHRSTL